MVARAAATTPPDQYTSLFIRAAILCVFNFCGIGAVTVFPMHDIEYDGASHERTK